MDVQQERKEDQKQAVIIVTTLSGQLMAAALAMIALEGAFLTFALDKKSCGLGFWLFVSSAFAVFVLSIFLGGKGIAAHYKAGADGNWNYSEGNARFRWQTALCLLGLVLFLLAVISAQTDKPSEAEGIQNAIIKVADGLDKQTVAIQQLSSQSSTYIATQLTELKRQLDKLQSELAMLNGRTPVVISNVVQIAGSTDIIHAPLTTNIVQLSGSTSVVSMPVITNIIQVLTNSRKTRRWMIGIGGEREN